MHFGAFFVLLVSGELMLSLDEFTLQSDSSISRRASLGSSTQISRSTVVTWALGRLTTASQSQDAEDVDDLNVLYANLVS